MVRTPRPPSTDEAADRISAYVYGNILVLAALVLLTNDDIDHGAGLAIVAGTAVSTFVAHAFAERLGSAVREGEHARMRVVLRDSLPIISSAALPALLMGAGAIGWISPAVALRIAEVSVVVRLGGTAFVVSRLQGRAVTAHTWFESMALAVTAVAIVGLKLLLTH
ncbi:hypothetical protein [Aeromicrobium endophyticum]|uniref:Integral membrane protein n=1 Tax=Aeromicrobium endophyticum TaxID=2292704 RepID=A0A371P4Y8_9ACTN|nr:hypothetical protein [Aeromicrobium endophyticum]REK70915.1 hypothetical protein DX116_17705 [Aeromicrobium endophyticum]